MPELVIFCESYGEITYDLQLIRKHIKGQSVTMVIPELYNLFKFYQVINEKVFQNSLRLVYIEPFQPKRTTTHGIQRLFLLFSDIIREKICLHNTYKKNFSGLKDADIFLISQGLSGLKLYLIRKLSKRNHIRFLDMSLGQNGMAQSKPQNITELARLIFWKLIYGNNVTIGSLPYTRGFIFVSYKFMKNNVYSMMDATEVKDMVKDFDYSPYKVFQTGIYDIIFFDDNLLGSEYISDSAVFKRELDNVFSTLFKYYPKEKIAVKYHPCNKDNESLVNTGEILPSFIPAQLLYNDKTKMYLSIISTSLGDATNGLSVSVVNLFTFKSEDIKNKLVEQLVRMSKAKILFPKSFKEFEHILIDLKNADHLTGN